MSASISLKTLTDALKQQGLTISTAESCTGGGLAFQLTQLSGSSAWFNQGVVTYSNEAKMNLIHVSESALIEFGAVSESVAKEMAEGVRSLANADIGIGITGIAGPTGGTADKPVGTVWIGVATKELISATRYVFEGDRDAVRAQSIDAAIELALTQVL